MISLNVTTVESSLLIWYFVIAESARLICLLSYFRHMWLSFPSSVSWKYSAFQPCGLVYARFMAIKPIQLQLEGSHLFLSYIFIADDHGVLSRSFVLSWLNPLTVMHAVIVTFSLHCCWIVPFHTFAWLVLSRSRSGSSVCWTVRCPCWRHDQWQGRIMEVCEWCNVRERFIRTVLEAAAARHPQQTSYRPLCTIRIYTVGHKIVAVYISL